MLAPWKPIAFRITERSIIVCEFGTGASCRIFAKGITYPKLLACRNLRAICSSVRDHVTPFDSLRNNDTANSASSAVDAKKRDIDRFTHLILPAPGPRAASGSTTSGDMRHDRRRSDCWWHGQLPTHLGDPNGVDTMSSCARGNPVLEIRPGDRDSAQRTYGRTNRQTAREAIQRRCVSQRELGTHKKRWTKTRARTKRSN